MKLPSILRPAFAAAIPLLLAACASISPSPPISDDAARQAATRPYHQTINLGGRISVQYHGRDKEEFLHGGFVWQQTPAHTAISLLSPLGQTIAVIEVTPRGASLTQGGHTMHAADVDTLTSDRLGWPLPVAGMREWLQGFAINADGEHFVATPHNDTVITADGWQIRYVAWQHNDAQPGQIRPRRVDLARVTAQAGEVRIRIVIDSWQTP
jgi:outer membrane lipoprotein LolB